METKASYVAVGAFVLALVAGTVVFVIWLARYQGQLESAYYAILIPGSVTGLQVEGTVRYRGISVGRGADIKIDAQTFGLVRVTIQGPHEPPLPERSFPSTE